MSEIKLDIPDITVLIDKGDEYKVIVNKPGSVVKNITGSYITVADSALTSSYALTASFVDGGTIASASYATLADSASVATTASYALNAQGTGFPFNGSAVITGSLLVSQSGVTVTGSIDTTTSVKSREFILNAGEVSVVFTGSVTSGIFGATEYVHPFIPTSSFMAASVEYVAIRQGALRVGTLMSGWSGSTIMMTDVSTTDIGDTSDIRFTFIQNDGYVKLRVESVGSGSYAWTVQSLFKLFPTLL